MYLKSISLNKSTISPIIVAISKGFNFTVAPKESLNPSQIQIDRREKFVLGASTRSQSEYRYEKMR